MKRNISEGRGDDGEDNSNGDIVERAGEKIDPAESAVTKGGDEIFYFGVPKLRLESQARMLYTPKKYSSC